MNKKAAVVRFFWWFFRIPLLVVMIFLFIFVRSRVVSYKVDTGSLEYDVLVNRIFKTFAYVSPNTGRTYPHILDQNKFDEEILNNSLITKKPLAIKISLTNTTTIFFNKELYEITEPIKGISKYKEIFQSSPIQILTKENKIIQGAINISIIYEQK